MIWSILYILGAYLLGSIPFGYLFTLHATGLNILEHGSGNIGSTNVKRVGGKKVAFYTQLCDMAKGLTPILVYFTFSYPLPSIMGIPIQNLIALSAILGHDFSLFLRFRGGKGVNTSVAACFLLTPVTVLLSVALYFLVHKFTKYVSLGSLSIAFSLPLFEWVIYGCSSLCYTLIVVALLIIMRHIPNIIRLIQGKENRI